MPEINKLFQVNRLNDQGLAKADMLAKSFDDLLTDITNILTNDGDLADSGQREFALVKTNLEQACFYAKKAMALNPKNQVS